MRDIAKGAPNKKVVICAHSGPLDTSQLGTAGGGIVVNRGKGTRIGLSIRPSD